MADETKTIQTNDTPKTVTPVQVPATSAVPDAALTVSDDQTVQDRDPFYGQGGTFTIDPATGKRVRV